MERSEIRDFRRTYVVPGLREACHRAALRADPLAPSGLQFIAIHPTIEIASRHPENPQNTDDPDER